MESIGEKLRQSREEKGFTLEQVARDTHIAKRFIEAMEQEDFDVFPGEPYLLGFLRTYSEFLELDPQEMVSLYKNLKLQEQPAPMDELLVKRRSPKPYIVSGIVVAALALVGVGVFLLFSSGVFSRASQASSGAEASSPETAGETYTLSEEILEQRFLEGAVINIPVGEEEYPLVVSGVGSELTLTTPAGSRGIAPDEEAVLDLNEDGEGDVRLTVRQTDAESSPPSVVMRLDRVVNSPNVASQSEPAERAAAGAATDTAPVGSTDVGSRELSSSLILEAGAPRSFSVEIAFQGATMFRYEADGTEREQEYVQNGDSFSTEVEREFRLWLSNAGAARVRVADRQIDVGEPGEVTARLVSWVTPEGSDVARLELIPMY
jgi:cytoskeletal protein RodZ